MSTFHLLIPRSGEIVYVVVSNDQLLRLCICVSVSHIPQSSRDPYVIFYYFFLKRLTLLLVIYSQPYLHDILIIFLSHHENQ